MMMMTEEILWGKSLSARIIEFISQHFKVSTRTTDNNTYTN